MGVQVGGGKGRGRPVNSELNLVPFIDLLSVCITFLLATAVWVEFSSMPVDQAIGEAKEVSEQGPPMTLHLRADGLWIGREARSGLNLAVDRGGYDWAAARDALSAQRDGSRRTVLQTDDGVAWRHVVAALDVLVATGYDTPQLAGGPAAVP